MANEEYNIKNKIVLPKKKNHRRGGGGDLGDDEAGNLDLLDGHPRLISQHDIRRGKNKKKNLDADKPGQGSYNREPRWLSHCLKRIKTKFTVGCTKTLGKAKIAQKSFLEQSTGSSEKVWVERTEDTARTADKNFCATPQNCREGEE